MHLAHSGDEANSKGPFPLGRLLPLALALAAALSTAASAADKKELRYNVGPNASIIISNEFGPVTIRPSSGRQVLISGTPSSNKVEVDGSQNGQRIEVRSHLLQRVGENEGRVDYDVQVPADASVTVRSASGPIRVERIQGELSVEGDGAQVELRDINSGRVRVRTMNGPVTLTNISNGYVEVQSVGGAVTLSRVSGPKVAVNTTSGAIRYDGDFAGGGEYTLTNHSGDIDVTVPASASVDITARSVNGSVQNDLPLQPKPHPGFAEVQGRSFAGTVNSGSSSVRLRSFSGKIRVKKQ